MPIIDLFKRVIPKVGAGPADSDGPANIQTALEAFSSSIHAPIAVASLTEANQIAAAAPDSAFPLFVWRADMRTLIAKSSREADWDLVGGRAHGLSANLFQDNLPEGVSKHLGIGTITRQSDGWQLSSDSTTLTVPAAGLYLFSVRMTINGVPAALGRTYIELRINERQTRVGIWNDELPSVTMMRPCNRGDKVKIYYYHAGGGKCGVQEGDLTIAQLLNPSW